MSDVWSPAGWEYEQSHASCRAQGKHLPSVPRLLEAGDFCPSAAGGW